MLIFGIDPGIGITGYSFIEVCDDKYNLITSGSIQTDKKAPHPKRLLELKNDIDFLIKKYKPDCASIEQLFFFKNQKTIIPVAQARGVILLTAKINKIPIYEYTPLQVKQAVVGYGRADKMQVQRMVKMILHEEKLPKLDDTTDSMAIAICHAHSARFSKSL